MHLNAEVRIAQPSQSLAQWAGFGMCIGPWADLGLNLWLVGPGPGPMYV